MEALTLRSSISQTLMRSSIWRGTSLAGLGVIVLLVAGTFLPLAEMKVWGLPLFGLGIGLITWGLLPYRRMKRLETNPYTLTIDHEWLHLAAKGRAIYSIPRESIEGIDFVEQREIYGMGISLKKPIPKKVIVHVKLRKYGGYDLFLPYFSRRAYEQLLELS